MTTTIKYVGSHGPGSVFESLPSDPIEALFTLLDREPLMPSLEPFLSTEPGEPVRLFGNFHTVSWAFWIDTDDAALIERWRAAVEANMAGPGYAEAKRAEAERVAWFEERRRQREEQDARWRR